MLKVMVFSVLVLVGCKHSPESGSLPEEAMNAQKLKNFDIPTYTFGDLSQKKARGGFLEQSPWVDDYWPLYKKNLSRRYFDYIVHTNGVNFAQELVVPDISGFKEFSLYGDQAQDMHSTADRLYRLSPAEKYDYLFNQNNELMRENWSEFEKFNGMYANTGEWRWMGICHGWSLASYSESAPLNHVMVKKGGKSVLFFEGDIRGLVSKVYAHNDFESISRLGNRCRVDKKNMQTDPSGRIVDIGFGGNEVGYFRNELNKWQYIGKNWKYAKILFLDLNSYPASSKQVYLVIPADGRTGDLVGGYLFSNLEAITRAVENGNVESSGLRKNTRVLTSCRDINPAEFHSALVRHYSDHESSIKKGLITEVDRASQVWNHPVWGFESIVSAIEPIAEYGRRAEVFSATGATHMAEVKTKLVYMVEEGPNLSYEDKDIKPVDPDYDVFETLQSEGDSGEDRFRNNWLYSTKTYQYNLEFRETWGGKFELVGGEWADSKQMGQPLNTPDFMWVADGIKDTYKGKRSPIRYSDVKKILNCSQDRTKKEHSKVLKKRTSESAPNGQNRIYYMDVQVKYVECEI